MEQKLEQKPYYKFFGFLAENGIKHETVALKLGITNTTFSKKINRKGADFTAREIKTICKIYDISADEYFFNLKVSN